MMENPEPRPIPHTRAESYCFLCQNNLPMWPGNPSFHAEDWEEELVAGTLLPPFSLKRS